MACFSAGLALFNRYVVFYLDSTLPQRYNKNKIGIKNVIYDTAKLPKTQKEALEKGSKVYFNGVPCIHGHIAPREAKGAGCRECARLRSVRWKAEQRAAGKPLKYSHLCKPGYWEKYRKEQRVKVRARDIMTMAVLNGKLKRMPCEVCGSTKRIHGHHEDYSKPLEVKWLCALHHQERHTEIKKNLKLKKTEILI